MCPRGVALTLLTALLLTGCADEQAARPTPTLAAVRPTARPAQRQPAASDTQLITRLPGLIEQIDLATHPQEDWPAVAAVQYWNFGSDPATLFVRAFDPEARRWGPAQQLDTGAANLGSDAFHGAAIAVAPDGTVHAVWGASDADGGLWASASTDHGRSWSAPSPIATGCWHVRSLAAAPDGGLLALAFCVQTTRDEDGSGPSLIARTPAGRWLPPQQIPLVAWDGDLVISGDQAVALVVPRLGGDDPFTGFVLTRPLEQPGTAWRIQPTSLIPPGLSPADLGDFAWHVQGAATADGALFVWAGYDRASVFALRVTGETVGPAQRVVGDAERTAETGRAIWHAVPAAEHATGRLAAVWSCCGDPLEQAPATHRGAWSLDGVTWRAALYGERASADGTPLALEGRRVTALAGAQAPGSRALWLGWVEGGQELVVRALPLNQLIPTELEP